MDKDFCLTKANQYINDYESRTCCADCQCVIKFHLENLDTPGKKAKADQIHDIIQAMMFSSGYWCKYKMFRKGDGYDVSVTIEIMTPEEKQRALHIPEDMD